MVGRRGFTAVAGCRGAEVDLRQHPGLLEDGKGDQLRWEPPVGLGCLKRFGLALPMITHDVPPTFDLPGKQIMQYRQCPNTVLKPGAYMLLEAFPNHDFAAALDRRSGRVPPNDTALGYQKERGRVSLLTALSCLVIMHPLYAYRR